jgi:hypothetical protein
MWVELEEMVSLQTEGRKNLELNEKNLKKLYVQRTFWRGNSRMHCVGHFIVLMITKKLMQQLLKLCNVFFVTIIQY